MILSHQLVLQTTSPRESTVQGNTTEASLHIVVQEDNTEERNLHHTGQNLTATIVTKVVTTVGFAGF